MSVKEQPRLVKSQSIAKSNERDPENFAKPQLRTTETTSLNEEDGYFSQVSVAHMTENELSNLNIETESDEDED